MLLIRGNNRTEARYSLIRQHRREYTLLISSSIRKGSTCQVYSRDRQRPLNKASDQSRDNKADHMALHAASARMRYHKNHTYEMIG